MRILVVTQDDPFYLPPALHRLCAGRPGEVVGIALLPALSPRASTWTLVRRHLPLMGVRTFALYSLRYVWYNLADRLGLGSPEGTPRTIRGVARVGGIPLWPLRSVQDPVFLRFLREEVRPDILVSIAASEVFRSDLLHLAPLGAINVHSSLLPHYRGMLPTFWVLLHGERETGVTVHYMAERLDAGQILLQRRVAIAPAETVESLIRKCKGVGAELLLEALALIEEGAVHPRPVAVEEGSYFSFPTRADVRRFRAWGGRFR